MRVIERSVNLNEMCRVEPLPGVAFTGESGHQFVITGFAGNEPVFFEGGIAGQFRCPDGTPIEFTPSYTDIDSEGRAVVTLPDNCYLHGSGPFGIIITNVINEKPGVIYAAAGFMQTGESASPVDPENVVNVDAIVAIIDDMYTAIAACAEATEYIPDVIAPEYNPLSTYAIGDWVSAYDQDNGWGLYWCNTPITTAGTGWGTNKTKFTKITVGKQITDTRISADGVLTLNLNGYQTINCTISSTATLTVSGTTYQSKKIPRNLMWDTVKITANSTGATYATFFTGAFPTTITSGADVSGALATGETGRHEIATGATAEFSIPANTAYIIVTVKSSTNRTPESVVVSTYVNNTAASAEAETVQNRIHLLGESVPFVLESGDIDRTDGSDLVDEKRLRTDDFLQYSLTHVLVNELVTDLPLQIMFYFYDSEKNVVGTKGWLGSSNGPYISLGTFEDYNPAYYRVVIQRSGKPEISETQAAMIRQRVQIVESASSYTKFCAARMDDIMNGVTIDQITPYADANGKYTADFTVTIPNTGNLRNQIFNCLAKHTKTSASVADPEIRFYYGTGINGTAYFTVGGLDDYKFSQWRVLRPPFETRDLLIRFVIPSGCTVEIAAFYSEFDDHIDRNADRVRYDGHVRFPGGPQFTMPSVELCARAGFTSMIQIPKRLSDGVWIFYHDDSLVYNNTIIRQADGTQLPSTYNGTLWKNISSQEAFSWDWGISQGEAYAGLKPMRMEDFFFVCAKTGMKPMLSVHPAISDTDFEEIKAIAKRCGVLQDLGIIGFTAQAYSVFGNDIDTYVYIVGSGAQTENVIRSAVAVMDGLTGCTARRVIELFGGTAYDAYFGSNPYNAFEIITDAGYIASVASQNGATKPVSKTTGQIDHGCDIEYWTKEHGVTEFVWEYGYSTGLNW